MIRPRSALLSGVLLLGAPSELGVAHFRPLCSPAERTAAPFQPWADIGDRLLVAPADSDDDALACVEVTSTARDGSPRVHLVCGSLAPGPVHVMRAPLPREREPRRPLVRRATVRRLEMTGGAR